MKLREGPGSRTETAAGVVATSVDPVRMQPPQSAPASPGFPHHRQYTRTFTPIHLLLCGPKVRNQCEVLFSMTPLCSTLLLKHIHSRAAFAVHTSTAQMLFEAELANDALRPMCHVAHSSVAWPSFSMPASPETSSPQQAKPHTHTLGSPARPPACLCPPALIHKPKCKSKNP